MYGEYLATLLHVHVYCVYCIVCTCTYMHHTTYSMYAYMYGLWYMQSMCIYMYMFMFMYIAIILECIVFVDVFACNVWYMCLCLPIMCGTCVRVLTYMYVCMCILFVQWTTLTGFVMWLGKTGEHSRCT